MDFSKAEEAWIRSLEAEGYLDVRMHTFPPDFDAGEHIHEIRTAYVVVNGELYVTTRNGTAAYSNGDRFDVAPGSRHRAKTGTIGARLVVGVKP